MFPFVKARRDFANITDIAIILHKNMYQVLLEHKD